MRVRLGYVSINNTLNITTSKTITYSNFSTTFNYQLIDNIIKQNLINLTKILKYNLKNNIHFYRLSSSIIPLATHKNVNFNYIDDYKDFYDKLERIINNNKMRIDMHASNYCILNSTKKEVVEYSINSLKYYYNILTNLGIEHPIVVLHIGSTTFGKDNSIARFINNVNKLPKNLKNMIAIENDDKVFNIEDIVKISKELKIPIVLDYHHYLCNNTNNLEDFLEYILSSWKNTNLNPKIHFSSPQDKKNIRAHNDYINIHSFINFLAILKKYNQDIDIMLEAKQKDVALFKLVRELKYETNYKFIDDTTFEL